MKNRKVIIIAVIAVVLVLITTILVINNNYNKRDYTIEKVKDYNYFVLVENNQYGVIDKNGKKIIDTKYDNIKIPNPSKGVFIATQNSKNKVLNENGEEIFSKYELVDCIRLKNIASDLMYEKSVLRYYKNGKYGLIDFKGKEITKPIYDEIDGLPYKEGELLVKQNDKYGVINIKGSKLINIEYEQITVDGYYTEQNGYKFAGYIVSNKTQEGYRYGYINNNGKLILKVEYNQLSRITDIEDNDNAYLLGAKNGQFGVTKNDKEIIKNEYQSITYDTTNQILLIERSKKYGVASLDGKIIVPAQYDQIDVTGVYLYAKDNQGTTVYNSNGTEANIDTNIAILNTSNEKYKIRINSEDGTKYGIIGKDGKQIIEEKYNYIEYLYDNYFIVSIENSKLGVIDDKDNVKIQIENDSLQKVQDTSIIQSVIAKDNITKLYDKNMSKICEMKDAKIEVKDNYIVIYNENEKKYFNKEGNEIKNTEVYPNNVLFAQQRDNKWGFVNKDGDMVVEAKYDKVTEFNEFGFASVQKDEKWGAINTQGKEVVEPTYNLKDEIEPSFIGTYYQVKYGFGEVYYTDAK